MVTIKDIAKKAGVSYATVSRALNNKVDVNQETRRQIIKIAKQMGYRPNVIAQNLVNQRTNTLALIVPDVSNPFFGDISRSITDQANAEGYFVTICNTGWDADRQHLMLEHMQSQQVAGIIIKPTAFYEPGTFDSIRLPLVVFWHPNQDQTDFIEMDHSEGGKIATEHLIARGYRRIAYLGGAGTSPANQLRLLSYQQALQENNIRVDQNLISFGGFDLQSGYNRIKKLLESESHKPDAVFCANDYIALGVLEYLHEKKITVPDDFGVMGYDDIYFSSLPLINLTTIAQPRDVMGREAVNLILDQIDHMELAQNKKEVIEERSPAQILLKPELIVRATT
ncbi:MAG TPA: LacI family DNA-binding transcriptional regulator [Candidatus Eisenbacteria bacterium]|nr:LacI family DNA-binding transcriptional regulator [Candidatus Eisenbacteria bacterium]